MPLRFAATLAVGILIVAAASSSTAAEKPAGPVVDSLVEDDPSLVLPAPKIVYSRKLLPLWLKALNGPESDLRREVAEMIARAHRDGMPGTRKTVGPLIKVLTADDERPVVRLAIGKTLVVLDAREAAGPLFRLLDSEGLDYAHIVEPALASWDDKSIRKRWLARLDDATTRPGLMRLALRGLGQVRERDAAAPLWTLIQNQKVRSSLRVAAADALGRIQHSGLAVQARTLTGDKTQRGMVDRLIAATLLAQHSDDSGRELLLELAVDPQPAVAAVALRRLLEIDTSLVFPLIVELLKSRDANIRLLAARALQDRPVQSSVGQLGTLLKDRHPDVRKRACRILYSFGSTAKLATEVLGTATRILNQDDWRGQEQAALLMGSLNHKPSAARLVQLLDAPRDEARVAAAWALRKLAIPSTFPAMLACASRIAERRKQGFNDRHDERLVQLLQTFGQRKYKPAADVLLQLIPKVAPYSIRERVSAIWALGHLDVGGRKGQVSRLLQSRLADVNPLFPENNQVRAMAAVSLGRMKAADAFGRLRDFYVSETPQTEVGFACRWAIRYATGETLPGPVPKVVESNNWRLIPLSLPKPK